MSSSIAKPSEVQSSEEETQLSEDLAETREFVVLPEQHGQRLDRVLVQWVPEFSRSHLQDLLSRGSVTWQGVPTGERQAAKKVQAGQRIRVQLQEPPQASAFIAQDLPLQVVFEDPHVCVLNKGVGWVVHPAPGHWTGTLLNGLLHRYPDAAALPRAGIVHRLDKDTSGLMVVARSLQAWQALSNAIALREVKREYLALAHGVVTPPDRLALIDQAIARDPKNRLRMAVVASGRASQTEVTLLESHTAHRLSWLHCRLRTGRTHQIRVHLSHQGYPLVGDSLYGGRPAFGLERQALHAWRLGFAHPVSGEWLQFEENIPADMQGALQQAGLLWKPVKMATRPLGP